MIQRKCSRSHEPHASELVLENQHEATYRITADSDHRCCPYDLPGWETTRRGCNLHRGRNSHMRKIARSSLIVPSTPPKAEHEHYLHRKRIILFAVLTVALCSCCCFCSAERKEEPTTLRSCVDYCTVVVHVITSDVVPEVNVFLTCLKSRSAPSVHTPSSLAPCSTSVKHQGNWRNSIVDIKRTFYESDRCWVGRSWSTAAIVQHASVILLWPIFILPHTVLVTLILLSRVVVYITIIIIVVMFMRTRITGSGKPISIFCVVVIRRSNHKRNSLILDTEDADRCSYKMSPKSGGSTGCTSRPPWWLSLYNIRAWVQ